MSSAVLALAAMLAVATPTPAPPTRWVEDHAGLLSPATRAALDVRLEGYQHATGHQVVVWIDHTLGGAALDDWAVRTFAAWKLGRKGFDDGIAMFIFADDRMIDIEVGYGLEERVPDVIASRIIREQMAPRLQAGDPDGAVTAGIDALLAAIDGKAVDTGPAPAAVQAPRPWTDYVFGGLAALGLLVLFVKYPRAAMWILWAIMSSREGGDRGGFRGGGGRSGGGGARGGW